MSRRKKIRGITRKCLDRLGLHRWRMTRLYLGIPRNVRRELTDHYPNAADGFYACVYPTGRRTFVMAISDVPDDKLENVVAHEMAHILLHDLCHSISNRGRAEARDQLEVVCNRIANAVTRRS